MLERLRAVLYVQVRENHFEIRRVGKDPVSVAVPSTSPFTTRRLLVGTFSVAERTLREALCSRLRLILRPVMVIHPMVMVEDGLSEVEARLFHELGRSAGAWRVELHTGEVLSDAQVRRLAGE